MAQLSCPLEATVTLTVSPDPLVTVRQRRPPASPDVQLRAKTRSAVPVGQAAETVPPVPVATVGCDPMPPVALKVAHSLACPSSSPMAAPAAAAFRAPMYCGRATADRMPITATTIISSTKVKPSTPFWRFRSARCMSRRILNEACARFCVRVMMSGDPRGGLDGLGCSRYSSLSGSQARIS